MSSGWRFYADGVAFGNKGSVKSWLECSNLLIENEGVCLSKLVKSGLLYWCSFMDNSVHNVVSFVHDSAFESVATLEDEMVNL